MTIESILLEIRNFLRNNTEIQTLTEQRVYLSVPKKIDWTFILIRNLASPKSDILDQIINIEIRIVAWNQDISHVDLMKVSEKLEEILSWYDLTLWSFTPYKWVKEMWPVQHDEWMNIKSIICDYQFYYVE